jgi:hypothetical protein
MMKKQEKGSDKFFFADAVPAKHESESAFDSVHHVYDLIASKR